MGCTDVEACIYAGTNRTSLTNYQNDNHSFLDKKEQLKKTPVLKARLKIISSINKSVNTARWYLEHKEKDEFSTKQETEHTGNINTTVIHTKEDALKEIEELKKELKDGKKD